MGFHLNDGTTHWQQPEEKVEQLKEKLSIALLDASAKDVLIKQHAKVAEEAVAGWEKAETEALNLKHELEIMIQQKLATEDRVSHLDEALKECMQQLRHVREEQETKIHDVTMKNLRDWEKAHAALEQSLAEMEQRYQDADAKCKAMSLLLQERALKISEITDAHFKAEDNSKLLQARLEAMERDQIVLKLGCNNLKKGLGIQNEDKVFNRGPPGASNKQIPEDIRKITKSEAYNQRLVGLSGRRPPGTGALTQKKLEVDVSKMKQDNDRKKYGKSLSTPMKGEEESKMSNLQPDTVGCGRDVDALLDRLSAMEDEIRRLKELVARKDNELQQSRFICAKTATKLSSVEEQLERVAHGKINQQNDGVSTLDKHIEAARSFTVSCDASLASLSEDGNDDCSDAWASALISELAQFKIEKTTSQATHSETPKMQSDSLLQMDPSIPSAIDDIKGSQCNSQKDVEPHPGEQCSDHAGPKVQNDEKELIKLQSQNVLLKSCLHDVRSQLEVFEAQEIASDVNTELTLIEELIGVPQQNNACDGRTIADFEQPTTKPSLTSGLNMLTGVLKALGILLPSLQLSSRNSDIETKLTAFFLESQLFLQNSAEVVQILKGLSSVLAVMMRAKLTGKEIGDYTSRKPFFGNNLPQHVEDYKTYGTIPGVAQSHVCDKQANQALSGDKSIVSAVPLEKECSSLQEELMKVRGEKVALETHMRMEFSRFEGLHTEVTALQGEKMKLEGLVEVLKEEINHLKMMLHQEEQMKFNFQEKFSSFEFSRHTMEEQLQSLITTKADAESQLKKVKLEHVWTQDRKEFLEKDCHNKKEKIAMLELKCQELEKQLSGNTGFICSKCSMVNDGDTGSKEQQEISSRSTERQQSIQLLGNQLGSCTLSRRQFDGMNDPSRETFNKFHAQHHQQNALDLPQGVRGSTELCTGIPTFKQTRFDEHVQNEIEWESHRDSNASDLLDSELMSLSKSGRPLVELFGDKTPAHEHYIKAVEELTSSSDEELKVSKRPAPSVRVRTTARPPNRSKNNQRSFRGAGTTKSMDDTSSEKLNTFTRLFSRGKNS
ncbi:hypothetical protein KP509_29G015700 [Ceratopteris richardii]|nr:hypothetical protein KP509_29G015700 [Ceratopteris richardii]